METGIPILNLTAPEKIWMKEVHSRNLVGQRFSVRDVWSALHSKLPRDFRPAAMDPRLISAGGENVRILGIIALQENYSILDKADIVINWIREELLSAPETSEISNQEVAQGTGLTKEEVHIVLQTITEFGQFYRMAKFDVNNLFITGIQIGNDDDILYRYITFIGIRQLIESKKYDQFRQPIETFTFEEIMVANAKVDTVLKEIQKLKAGQEVIWTDIRKDIEELKALYFLGKKNWRQIMIGKIGEMVASGIISDTLSKTIEEMFKPISTALLPF